MFTMLNCKKMQNMYEKYSTVQAKQDWTKQNLQ